MNRDDAEEWTAALGQSMTGGWRLVLLAQRMGVPAALGMSTQEWVRSIGGYVRVEIDERREAARELVAPVDQGGEGLSQREAAAVLGVGQATVQRDVSDPDGSPAVVPDAHADTRIDPDGSRLPRRPPVIDPERERADAERQARSDLYTGICRAVQTVGAYGGYADIDALMAEFGPDELDPPQIARALARDNLTAARHLIDELMVWQALP
ncbi:hypothetical protein [Cellulomonas xylanilytica]|uniref:hypothetical protein n=1 Tax=Cellulomonas xylanilytica TaxID=233583 RepID=UPI0011BEEDFC|nr:hypothetical protein [Cellulomonas xylanilytica]